MSAVGADVGSCITAEGSIRSPEEPRWLGPPFVPSVARGVGSNGTSVSAGVIDWRPAGCDVEQGEIPVGSVGSSFRTASGSALFRNGSSLVEPSASGRPRRAVVPL